MLRFMGLQSDTTERLTELNSLYASQLKQETEALSTIYSSQDMTQKQPKHLLTDKWNKKIHIHTHTHTLTQRASQVVLVVKET